MDLVFFGSSIPEFAYMKDSFLNAVLVSFTFLLFSLYLNNVHTVVSPKRFTERWSSWRSDQKRIALRAAWPLSLVKVRFHAWLFLWRGPQQIRNAYRKVSSSASQEDNHHRHSWINVHLGERRTVQASGTRSQRRVCQLAQTYQRSRHGCFEFTFALCGYQTSNWPLSFWFVLF